MYSLPSPTSWDLGLPGAALTKLNSTACPFRTSVVRRRRTRGAMIAFYGTGDPCVAYNSNSYGAPALWMTNAKATD